MTDSTQAPARDLRSLNAEEVESTLAGWGLSIERTSYAQESNP